MIGAMREKHWLWLMVAVVAFSFAMLAWMAWSMRGGSGERGAWRDASGRLHVLGVVLGQSSLREAEQRLKSRSDVALFIYPVGHPKAGMKLEASFPSIADHTKVFLLLDADASLLHAMERRATAPHLYPNGVARMNLSPQDRQRALRLPVRELTLIPSAKLGREDVLRRFGEPARIVKDAEGREAFEYPRLGLRLTFDADGAVMLRFSP